MLRAEGGGAHTDGNMWSRSLTEDVEVGLVWFLT